MNNSELYKKSGIIVDDNWFQEVTESAEDTVREFLEVSKEQCKDKANAEYEKQKQDRPMKMKLKLRMTMILTIIVR